MFTLSLYFYVFSTACSWTTQNIQGDPRPNPHPCILFILSLHTILGRYFIYTWTCNADVKRERKKSNKRFSLVSIPYWRKRDVFMKRHVSVKREREVDRYMKWCFTLTDSIRGWGGIGSKMEWLCPSLRWLKTVKMSSS